MKSTQLPFSPSPLVPVHCQRVAPFYSVSHPFTLACYWYLVYSCLITNSDPPESIYPRHIQMRHQLLAKIIQKIMSKNNKKNIKILNKSDKISLLRELNKKQKTNFKNKKEQTSRIKNKNSD